MNVIYMNSEKQLIHTIKQPIYRGENLVDSIQFLLPIKYGNHDMTEFSVVMQCIKNEEIIQEVALEVDGNYHKNGWLSYTFSVESSFTKQWGKKEIQLRISKVNVSSQDEYILKTSSCTLWVFPSKDYFISDNDESDLQSKLDELNSSIEIIKEILATKADDIIVDSISNELYLTVDGQRIGTGVTIDQLGNAIAERTTNDATDNITRLFE